MFILNIFDRYFHIKYLSQYSMGSGSSKCNEETNDVKAVEEMNEDEMSSKDKMFKKAIVEIYEELRAVKNQKKDKLIYTIPKVDLCNWSLF